jgi:hypothetical protein
MNRVPNRFSRSSSVIYESSHFLHGTYNVSTSAWLPLGREFQKRRFRPILYFHKEVDVRDHRRKRWRDPSAVGVVSPRGQGIYPRTVSLSSKFILHTSKALTNKVASLTNIEKYQKSSSRCSIYPIDLPWGQSRCFPTRRSQTISVHVIIFVIQCK